MPDPRPVRDLLRSIKHAERPTNPLRNAVLIKDFDRLEEAEEQHVEWITKGHDYTVGD